MLFPDRPTLYHIGAQRLKPTPENSPEDMISTPSTSIEQLQTVCEEEEEEGGEASRKETSFLHTTHV